MKRFLMVACAVAAVVAAPSADDKKAGVLFQAAEAKATVQGDLKAAITLYEDAVKEAGANRALAAKALVRMAESYQKLGDAEAQKIYSRIVRDYGDQAEAVVVARARLIATRPVAAPTMVFRKVWAAPLDFGEGSVSRDGRFIAYPAWETGDLALLDLVTGASRHLTEHDPPGQRYVEYAKTRPFLPTERMSCTAGSAARTATSSASSG